MEAEWKGMAESLGLPSSFSSGEKRRQDSGERQKRGKRKKATQFDDFDDPIDEEDLIKQLSSKSPVPRSTTSQSSSLSMFALQEYYQEYEGKLPLVGPPSVDMKSKKLNGMTFSESPMSIAKSFVGNDNNGESEYVTHDEVDRLNEWGIPLEGKAKGKRVLLDGEDEEYHIQKVQTNVNNERNQVSLDEDGHPPRRVLLNLPPLPPSSTAPSLPVPSRLSSILPSSSSFASTVPYAKFYHQRRSLFSLFDEGILLDYVGMYSCTPEVIAVQQREMAEQWVMQGRKMRKYNSRQNGEVTSSNIVREDEVSRPITVIDVFGGCGGNAIQFALSPLFYVVTIEYDPIRLACLKHNYSIYSTHYQANHRNIEYVYGDSMAILKGGRLKGDLVFMSPPWGGVDYAKKQWDGASSADSSFDLRRDLSPLPALELLRLGFRAADHVAICLPKNCREEEIRGLLHEMKKRDLNEGVTCGYECYIQYNTVRGVLKTLTAYFRRKTFQEVKMDETTAKPKRKGRKVAA